MKTLILTALSAMQLLVIPVWGQLTGSASASTSTISVSVPSCEINEIVPLTVTIQLKDVNGNNLTKGGDLVSMTTTLGTISITKDNLNGTYFAQLKAGNVTGTAIVKGYVNGVEMTNTAAVVFTLPRNITGRISSDVIQLEADGTSQAVILVSVRDQFNSPVGNAPVEIQTTAGTLSPVEYLSNGLYKSVLTSSVIPQAVTVTFSLYGVPQSSVARLLFTEPSQAKVFIPEGFSPDGDGVNDTFVIGGLDKNLVSLRIFNRWGVVVYDSPEYKNDWNGTANQGLAIGENLPDGTYFYSINMNDGNKPLLRSITIKRK
jgi:gliding motility-associated-like protein